MARRCPQVARRCPWVPERWSWMPRRWFWEPGEGFGNEEKVLGGQERPILPVLQPCLVRVCAHVALLQGPAIGTWGHGDGAAQGPLGRMSHVPWPCGFPWGDITYVHTLGSGMQRPPPGIGTLSIHGQWGPSPGPDRAEGMWVPPHAHPLAIPDPAQPSSPPTASPAAALPG